jgi:hypothetical protein
LTERRERRLATRGQTHAKRDRERALREKRERKQAKKAEAAAQRAAGDAIAGSGNVPGTEEQAGPPDAEWIR